MAPAFRCSPTALARALGAMVGVDTPAGRFGEVSSARTLRAVVDACGVLFWHGGLGVGGDGEVSCVGCRAVTVVVAYAVVCWAGSLCGWCRWGFGREGWRGGGRGAFTCRARWGHICVCPCIPRGQGSIGALPLFGSRAQFLGIAGHLTAALHGPTIARAVGWGWFGGGGWAVGGGCGAGGVDGRSLCRVAWCGAFACTAMPIGPVRLGSQ